MTPAEFQSQRRWYFGRLIGGGLLLLMLAIPATIHSAAAIATLRNLPAEWLPMSLPLRQDFIRFIDRFGVPDVILVTWPGANLDDPSVAEVVKILRPLTPESEQSGNLDFHDRFRTLCAIPQPIDWVRSGTEIRDHLMAPPLSASQRSAAGRLRGTLVGDDGQQTCLMIALSQSTGPHQRELLPMMRSMIAETANVSPAEVAMVGGPVDGAAVDGEAIRSINRYALPSSILAAFLCWICLRSIPMTAVVVGVATIGQGLSLAAVYYVGITMNAVLIVLPPLVFVLTISSGIHLCNYYLDASRKRSRDASGTNLDADLDADPGGDVADVRQAMRQGVPPCLMATLTTVVGLSSLALVRLEPVRVFGVIASACILLTLAMLVLLLPGAMLLTRTRHRAVPENDGGMLGSRAWWLRPRLIIAVFALLTSVVAIGLGNLRTSVSVTGMFRHDSELRQQYRWFEHHVGATMTGDVLLTFPSQEVETNAESDRSVVDQLRRVIDVHGAIQKLPSVGGVLSCANFLPVPSKSGSLASVARRSAIAAAFRNDDSEIYRLGYVDKTSADRTWRISMRLFQTGNNDFSSQIKTIQATAEKAVAEGRSGQFPTVSITGHVVIVEGSQKLLLQDLFNSFMAAFAVIAVLMVIYLRSIAGGILSMIPNVIPTVLLFGSMGWLRLPLDIGSVMTASVALGIAIDDTVHLLARFRSFRLSTGDRRAAAVAAVRQCGWAMLQTTIVCSLSLLVYGLSEFVPTRRFAFFMLGLLAVAWLGVATLLPAIMTTRFGEYFAKRR